MSKNNDVDFELIKEMSQEQQQKMYYTLAKRANQRFRDLNKGGYHSKAVDKAQQYLIDNFNRTTFKQSKILQGIELKEGLKELERFYTSKSSSATGIKKIQAEQIENFGNAFEDEDNYNKFKKMMKGKKIKKNFFNFLSSQQFRTMSKYADSNQVIEDFTQAISNGFTEEQILQEYEDFLNTDMTFEQIEERRNSGGDMLH